MSTVHVLDKLICETQCFRNYLLLVLFPAIVFCENYWAAFCIHVHQQIAFKIDLILNSDIKQ